MATQIDLRFDEKVVQKLAGQEKLPVSPSEGEMMARHLGAARYFECSANKGQGVDDVFDQVRGSQLAAYVLPTAVSIRFLP